MYLQWDSLLIASNTVMIPINCYLCKYSSLVLFMSHLHLPVHYCSFLTDVIDVMFLEDLLLSMEFAQTNMTNGVPSETAERRDRRDEIRDSRKRHRSQSQSESPPPRKSSIRDRERENDLDRDRERHRDRDRAHDFESERGRERREKSGSRERDDHDRDRGRDRDRDRRRRVK